MPITESSITLDFPDNNFFRFEDCQGYKNIQDNLKEMDACWYEQAADTLYIIELKDWKNNSLAEESDPNFSQEEIKEMKKRISDSNIYILLKKSIDSICMFMSILLNKPYSSEIQACSPFSITSETKIVLLTIINWESPDITYISSINTSYKSKFKPYARLFNIPIFLVMTKKQAIAQFGWVK